MSTSEEDGGFSLVEILVAMGLLITVMVASLPVFIAMLGSTVTTKLNTQGKNLSQERLEQVRDLRYHVDRQNGPFLDLLDAYYTNATPGAIETAVTSGSSILRGRYVDTGPAGNGMPAAPYFRTTTGPLPGASGFSQVIAAQFLSGDGSVLPAARFQSIYDSQTVGRDVPPTLLLALTVVTNWVQGGRAKTYRVVTQISESRPEAPLIQTQARAIAVDITSTGADGKTLELQAGITTLDGGQSSGSAVTGYVGGALLSRTGQASVAGVTRQFALPGQGVAPAGGNDSVGEVTGPGTSTCGGYSFGKSEVRNVSASIAAGLPQAPTNVDASTPRNTSQGAVVNAGSSRSCGAVSFDNLIGGGLPRPATVDVTTPPLGALMGLPPYIKILDGSGSASAVEGAGYVTATPLTAALQQSRAAASAFTAQPVVIFPQHPGVTDGLGLVSARLVSGSAECVSGTTSVAGSVVGKYILELQWWGRTETEPALQRNKAIYRYNSAEPTPFAVDAGSRVWDPSATLVTPPGATAPVFLSSLVTGTAPSANTGVVSTGASTGLRGFAGGVLTLTTASTLVNEAGPGFSAIKVQIGQLSCVADDKR